MRDGRVDDGDPRGGDLADIASLLPGLPQAELEALRESVRQLAAVTRWPRYESDRKRVRDEFDRAIDAFACEVRPRRPGSVTVAEAGAPPPRGTDSVGAT